MKQSKILFVVFSLLFFLALLYWFLFIHYPGGTCIQVLQDAQNPLTGQVKTFATPCSVPIGWRKIEPAILQ